MFTHIRLRWRFPSNAFERIAKNNNKFRPKPAFLSPYANKKPDLFPFKFKCHFI